MTLDHESTVAQRSSANLDSMIAVRVRGGASELADSDVDAGAQAAPRARAGGDGAPPRHCQLPRCGSEPASARPEIKQKA
eukprot:3544696-Rhodomonas_salina.3